MPGIRYLCFRIYEFKELAANGLTVYDSCK